MATSTFETDGIRDREAGRPPSPPAVAIYAAEYMRGYNSTTAPADVLREAAEQLERNARPGSDSDATLIAAVRRLIPDAATPTPQGACILTAENMHTADDCTMHDHESSGEEPTPPPRETPHAARFTYTVTVELSGAPGDPVPPDAGEKVRANLEDLLQRIGMGEGLISEGIGDPDSFGADSIAITGPPAELFALVEMADVELTGVHLYATESEGRAVFDQICEENHESAWDESELDGEIAGTLAVAGDDSYSVALIRRPIESAATAPQGDAAG